MSALDDQPIYDLWWHMTDDKIMSLASRAYSGKGYTDRYLRLPLITMTKDQPDTIEIDTEKHTARRFRLSDTGD